MLCYELLNEAGIKTAEVDRAAREAVTEHLPEIVNAFFQRAEPDIGVFERDEDGENAHRFYDDLYHWARKHEEEAVITVCKSLSEVLSIVVRKIANQRFGSYKAQFSFPVHLIPRDYSDDKLKHNGGYLDHNDGRIVVLIDAHRVVSAILGVVQDDLFGESEDSLNEFLATFVPTFMHEYAHWEQAERGKDFHKHDFSHVTLGAKRGDRNTETGKLSGKRFGKRGGVNRTPEKSTAHYMRYLGSTHEIDAFASGAASELAQDVRMRYGYSKSDYNQRIKELLQSITQGLVSGISYGRYYDNFNSWVENDVSPAERRKVWNIFQKTLAQKLQNYIYPAIGRSNGLTDIGKLNPRWLQQAEKLTMPKMISYLANETAHHFVDDEGHMSQEWIDKNIDGGWGNKQHEAEQFILQYYLRHLPWEKTDQLYDKIVKAFRTMTKKYVAWLLKYYKDLDL